MHPKSVNEFSQYRILLMSFELKYGVLHTYTFWYLHKFRKQLLLLWEARQFLPGTKFRNKHIIGLFIVMKHDWTTVSMFPGLHIVLSVILHFLKAGFTLSNVYSQWEFFMVKETMS